MGYNCFMGGIRKGFGQISSNRSQIVPSIKHITKERLVGGLITSVWFRWVLN
jgi:hypothetical protein